ncbi:uncharacterized protein MYCFIDRAFT_175300 [Pseudocercospora fijiensis CIRAD86]|uniref:Uncharacterized protein n=1 Tax=Pseudocercospora fijiensis (strain CIRAD86) TaxID=383855 RepID=M2YVH8_PSEFD|nr:uncharacterized protein MYCFIDRAFT_175300 [Pseudocercospora fijiensis CIRAD86]EME81710.1 hypothetical protein MYCFIDRAFT_175300 [Pseudocercospora fijiensis CIRAD86]
MARDFYVDLKTTSGIKDQHTRMGDTKFRVSQGNTSLRKIFILRSDSNATRSTHLHLEKLFRVLGSLLVSMLQYSMDVVLSLLALGLAIGLMVWWDLINFFVFLFGIFGWAIDKNEGTGTHPQHGSVWLAVSQASYCLGQSECQNAKHCIVWTAHYSSSHHDYNSDLRSSHHISNGRNVRHLPLESLRALAALHIQQQKSLTPAARVDTSSSWRLEHAVDLINRQSQSL